MKTKIEAVDKLRNIANWIDWMDENFNSTIRSVSDFEKLYDYCQKSEIYEFADQLPDRIVKKILGYK